MGSLGVAPDLSLRKSGGRFSPLSLFRGGEAGAWYDSADLSTLKQNSNGTGAVAVGDPVGFVADKSGRGNHAMQAGAGSRPILRQENGFHFLEFDGADDRLRSNFPLPLPWVRISALRQMSWTDQDSVFGGGNGGAAGRLQQANGAPGLRLADGTFSNVTILPAVGQDAVVTEVHNGAASKLSLNRNAPLAADPGSLACGGVTLGASHLDTQFANVRFYGVLMIGRLLGEAELGSLRRFMAARCRAVF